jgi:hypothetical protein
LVTAEIGTTGVCWDYVTHGTSHCPHGGRTV